MSSQAQRGVPDAKLPDQILLAMTTKISLKYTQPI